MVPTRKRDSPVRKHDSSYKLVLSDPDPVRELIARHNGDRIDPSNYELDELVSRPTTEITWSHHRRECDGAWYAPGLSGHRGL